MSTIHSANDDRKCSREGRFQALSPLEQVLGMLVLLLLFAVAVLLQSM